MQPVQNTKEMMKFPIAAVFYLILGIFNFGLWLMGISEGYQSVLYDIVDFFMPFSFILAGALLCAKNHAWPLLIPPAMQIVIRVCMCFILEFINWFSALCLLQAICLLAFVAMSLFLKDKRALLQKLAFIPAVFYFGVQIANAFSYQTQVIGILSNLTIALTESLSMFFMLIWICNPYKKGNVPVQPVVPQPAPIAPQQAYTPTPVAPQQAYTPTPVAPQQAYTPTPVAPQQANSAFEEQTSILTQADADEDFGTTILENPEEDEEEQGTTILR